MSSGWLSTAGDRLENRISLRIPLQMFPWTRTRGILLFKDAVWPKKCRSDLSAFGRQGILKADQAQPGVNADGLKVCPDKADAVLSLPSPRCLKDVQKLNGKLASLNRFLSKSAEKSLPFFKTLKKWAKKSDFQWTQEAEAAFKQMKKLVAKFPMLTAPKENEELIIYLAAAKEAISAVLMTEREGKQIPVYFVSRTLRGPEINYNPMEKLVLALLSASRRLKRYFQAHAIVVIMDQPIKQLLSRASIKGQILADFIMEQPEEESPDEPMMKPKEIPEPWTLFTDGSSCIEWFEATNNEAEYEALIAGVRIAEQMGVKNLQAHVDSRVVANQVLVEELEEKSINEKEILAVVEEEGNTWMTPIYEYITKEILPADKKKARAVRRKAARVRDISFKPDDMVYRSNDASHARDGGKLGPKWEGPYEVAESLGKGAYKLKDCKGNELPRTWNICNLKKCYIHEM
ncbi:reverse transcriptase domain-containing protein [Tanacetum coccineum]